MKTSTIIGIALVVSSLLLIAICLFHKREAFFNLRNIVKKHFELFKNSRINYAVFYFLPGLFAVGLAMLYSAAIEFYTELSVILGIILSVLLTILSILSNYDFSTVADEVQKKKGRKVVEDTINAITFSTLLCIFLLLYNLVLIILRTCDLSWVTWDLSFLKAAVSAVAYYLFAVICLNLLLIVKQMSKIIQFNLNVKKES
jgi:hypothetical protein